MIRWKTHARFVFRLFRTICLVWFIPSCLVAQPRSMRFEHLTTREGLSQSLVKCIVKDSQGYMWFGTFDGLNRFDGMRFYVYKHDASNSKSLLGNDVYTLCEHDNGDLWVGTCNGLSIFSKETYEFDNTHPLNEMRKSINNKQIFSIVKDQNGNMWLGTHSDGVYCVQKETNRIFHYLHESDQSNSLSSNNITALYADHLGWIWVGTLDSGLVLFKPEAREFIRFVHQDADPFSLIGPFVVDVTEDKDGNLWVACQNDGLSCLKRNRIETARFKNYVYQANDDGSLCTDILNKLYADQQGGVWVGTINGGLDYFDPAEKHFHHYKYKANDPNSLNNNSIHAIYQDDLGDLWVGTHAGGINVMHQSNQVFMHYLNVPGDRQSLSSNSVWDFTEDITGSVWIATDGGGLNCFHPETGEFSVYRKENSNLNVNAVLSVCTDQKGKIWVGTWAGGMSSFDPKNKRFVSYTTENGRLSDDVVFDIIEDRDGALWLGTLRSGAVKFNPETGAWLAFTPENSDIIYKHIEVLMEDCCGDIYMGSIQGVSIYSPRKNQFKSLTYSPQDSAGLSHGFITSLFEENDSTVWIGTMNGLNKYHKNSHKIVHYFEEDGLPGNVIKGICQDSEGFLWISTNNGLSWFNPEKGIFVNYTQADGLQGNEFVKNSCYETRNGHLLFGGVNGFNYFDPTRIVRNTQIPPVVITDFMLMNRFVNLDDPDCPIDKHISQVDTLILSYKQNIFSFFFSTLNFISPSKNKCAYMLEGFDQEWRNASNQMRMAVYTNIDPGHYVFRVKGANNDGIWNEEGCSIHIEITPPFWRTLWFRGSLILFLLVLVFLIIQTHTYRLKKQNITLEELVSQRTCDLEQAQKQLILQEKMAALGQIVATVAHEIRNPLGTVRSSIFTLRDAREKQDAKRMNRAMTLAERNILRCDNIITELLDFTRFENMKKEKVHINSWLKSIIQDMHDDMVQINLAGHADVEVELSSEDMRRAVINIIENAIQAMKQKDGDTSMKLDIQTRIDRNRLEMRFEDSGPGIAEEELEKIFEPLFSTKSFGVGLGLAIVRKIMEGHGGGVDVNSEVGLGTIFTLWLPLENGSAE